MSLIQIFELEIGEIYSKKLQFSCKLEIGVSQLLNQNIFTFPYLLLYNNQSPGLLHNTLQQMSLLQQQQLQQQLLLQLWNYHNLYQLLWVGMGTRLSGSTGFNPVHGVTVRGSHHIFPFRMKQITGCPSLVVGPATKYINVTI